MDEHWSTAELNERDVRIRYGRLLSRAAGGAEIRNGRMVITSAGEVIEELEAKLNEALEHGWLPDDSDLRTHHL